MSESRMFHSLCEHFIHIPMTHLQPGEAACRLLKALHELPGRVLLTMVAGRGRAFTRRVEWGLCLAISEGAQPSIIVEFVFVVVVGELLKVELVAEDGTDTTETLDELVTLGRTV